MILLPDKTSVLLLILTFLLMFSQAKAQQRSAEIQGRVSDKISGELLIGANVLLFSDTLSVTPIRGAITNRTGIFKINNIPYGHYFIKFSMLGYEILQSEIDIQENDYVYNAQLIKKSYQLTDALIQDKRFTEFSKTTSTIDIKPELLQKLPSIGGETDLFRTLILLPGVQTATEISPGIYVRGGSPDQNLTIVDGVNVYNPSHLGGFASTFNGDAIKSIKLMKGAFPAEFGGRLSSVLDIKMREGSQNKFAGNAALNLLSTRISVEGPLDTNSSFILSARKMYLDQISALFPGANSIPRYGFFDFNGKVNYSLSDKDKVFFSGFYSSDNLRDPLANKDYGFDINWSNSTANITWTRINSLSRYTTTSLMYTSYKFSTLIADKDPASTSNDFFTASKINDIQLKTIIDFYDNDVHNLKTGIEGIYHRFLTNTSDVYIREFGYSDSYGSASSTFEASYFIQDEMQINNMLKGNAGIRIHYFHSGQHFSIEPRLSLTYSLSERLILRGAFAIANQNLHMLTRDDIYLPTDVWYPSTGEILPSRSMQGSFGFETISMGRSFLFSLDAYYKDLSNLYEYKGNAEFKYNSPFEELLTKGRGESYGLEFFLNKQLGDLSGWIGYTVSYTRRYFKELNMGKPFYPRYDRRHDISFVLTYTPTKSFTTGLTWTYGTGQAFSLPTGQYFFGSVINPSQKKLVYYQNSARDAYRLPAFHKLDLSIQYIINFNESNLTLSLDIYNVYNRYNVFSKYLGYKTDTNGEKKLVLRQFTLFPFLPTLGINYRF